MCYQVFSFYKNNDYILPSKKLSVRNVNLIVYQYWYSIVKVKSKINLISKWLSCYWYQLWLSSLKASCIAPFSNKEMNARDSTLSLANFYQLKKDLLWVKLRWNVLKIIKKQVSVSTTTNNVCPPNKAQKIVK